MSGANRDRARTIESTTTADVRAPMRLHLETLWCKLYIINIILSIKMIKIIKYGFCPINNDRIRGQNDVKGRKLFESGHVLNVIETEDTTNQEMFVTCKVVAQTTVSNVYNVKITLDCNRNITDAVCSCKAGQSGKCKHMCALIHFVNSPESATSKTCRLQEWGKPSHRQLLGYDKGMRMTGLFPTPPLCAKAFGLEPCQISTAILGESLTQTPLFTMLKFEEKENSEIMAAESLAEIIRITKRRDLEEKVRKITLEIFMLQWGHTQFSTKIFTSRDLYNFYNEKVYCDIDTGLKISTGTIDQSQNSEWFKERKLRISASNAHKIKGTRFNIDKVINSLLTSKKIEMPAMSYGKKMEEHALREYQKTLTLGCEVIKVGLIICLRQPWLCCSPDGIVIYGSNIWEKRLVEIKCPYNCRNIPIFNTELSKLNVKYLKMDENAFRLNENHSIYTQIQIQMYVTNITLCDLYIYSPKGSILISVHRNNIFLANVIPCMEQFYFTHYLPKLCSTYA